MGLPGRFDRLKGLGRLPEGRRVRLKGLQSAARHNGTLATVVDFVRQSGRYVVSLDETGFCDASSAAGAGQKALRRSNLQQQVAGCRLRRKLAAGGTSVGGAGGLATLLDYDEAGRCVVAPELNAATRGLLGDDARGGEWLVLAPGELLLPDRTPVVVVGLQKAPEHNGTVRRCEPPGL